MLAINSRLSKVSHWQLVYKVKKIEKKKKERKIKARIASTTTATATTMAKTKLFFWKFELNRHTNGVVSHLKGSNS